MYDTPKVAGLMNQMGIGEGRHSRCQPIPEAREIIAEIAPVIEKAG
jgi:hypothetical protein